MLAKSFCYRPKSAAGSPGKYNSFHALRLLPCRGRRVNLKVLVTGGAGFIGSNFVRRALSGNYPAITNISVLDSLTYAGNLENLSPVMNSPRFEFVQGSILDTNLLGAMMSSADVLINFAAESHVDRSIENASKFVETNAVGVFEILEQLRKKSLRFLQVSTDEVYGSIANGTWTEESPLQPNSPYSASKASAELLCRAYHNTYGLDILVTRCSNNYGPYHHPEKFIPKSITNLLQNKPIKVYGNGLNSRDWIHVDDHCDGIYAAIQLGESGNIYNLGGGAELNNLELANQILGLMNRKSTEIEFVPDRLGHDFRYSVDSSKAQEKLNFKVKHQFGSGLQNTITWFENNHNWWERLI